MVFASAPLISLILFAALPVGAASLTLRFFFFIAWIMVFIMVVFPVPGPPVITITEFVKVHSTACLWASARVMPVSASTSFIILSVSSLFSGK